MDIDERLGIMKNNIVRIVEEQSSYALEDLKNKLEKGVVWREGNAPKDGSDFLLKVDGITRLATYDNVIGDFVFAHKINLVDVKYATRHVARDGCIVWTRLP